MGAVRFSLNGVLRVADQVAPTTTVLDWLRGSARLTGAKEGCAEGDCGACTILVSGPHDGGRWRAVNSCLMVVPQLDRCAVLTVEGVARNGVLHPVQQAMVKHHGSQCGFCTPGIVMSLFALYQAEGEPPGRAVINDCLAGNLCRCTGYRPIVDAAMEACSGGGADSFSAEAEARRAKLSQIADGDDVFMGTPERFFAAPASIAALAKLLGQYPDARLVAGATDVGLWITKKLQDIGRIIWLGRVSELDFVEESAAATQIGAGVSLAHAAPALTRIAPDLGEIMRRFGSAQVRSSGTVGGNIANGSPIGDLAPCLIALGAEIVLQAGGAQRRLPLEAFFIAYGKQDRASGEFVHSLEIEHLSAGQQLRAYKVSKRFDEDISSVLGAFCITVQDRRIIAARIAYGGMAATPRRAAMTEHSLIGASLDSVVTWEAAIEALGSDFQPLTDARASAGYRLATARALLQKALFEIAGASQAVTRVLPPREAVE